MRVIQEAQFPEPSIPSMTRNLAVAIPRHKSHCHAQRV
jgi:hypothetical protein